MSLSVAILGYLVHLSGMVVSKSGLFLQKLCHIDREKRENSPQDSEFVRFQPPTKKPVYCYCIWHIGFWMLIVGGGMQIAVLPFVSLVLISTNSITAIAFNTFLSVKYLGERMNWKYDLPAFALMGIGGFSIVMLAQTSEETFSREYIIQLLTSR